MNLRMEAFREQPPCVGLRDLEDVDVRIHLLADRGERRDRLVEHHEAAREPKVHRVDQLEPLANDLNRVDVREPGAVVPVEEDAKLGAELLLALGCVANAELTEPAWDRVDVLRRCVDEEASQLRHVVVRELSRLAEVDEPQLARLEDEDVRGVRVGVEEAVPEHHRHPRVREPVGDVAALVRPQRLEVEVRDLRPAQELERQDAPASSTARITRGTTTPSLRAKLRWKSSAFRASWPKSSSSRIERANSSTSSFGSMNSSARTRSLEQPRGLVEESEVGLDLSGGRRDAAP